jgi:hypothetical protein
MENKKAEFAEGIILSVFFVIAVITIFGTFWGWGCHIKAAFSDDLYCNEYYTSNISNAFSSYEIRSHNQDKINAENRIKQQEEAAKQAEIQQKCYAAGKDYNLSFDIIKDYGYTCPKLQYINDHFIDKTRQVDGGYIEGSSFGMYAGFGIGISSGYVEGKLYQYVTERVSATGQLVQNMKYHINCNEIKSNEIIDYYTESEFVMYYVDKCIQ